VAADLDAVLARAIDAATRLLAQIARGPWWAPRWPQALAQPPLDWLVLPWLIGRGGGAPPQLGEAWASLTATQVALMAGDDQQRAFDFLVANLDGKHRLGMRDASRYGDDAFRARLLGLVSAYPRRANVDGRMMVRTDPPGLVRAVLSHLGFQGYVGVIGELLIVAHDSETVDAAAAQQWAATATPPWYFEIGITVPFCDAAARLAARTDINHALDLLDVWEGPPARTGLIDAPEAVLARLVRQDPERAVAFVASRPTERRRIRFARHLLRWGTMPAAAVSLFERLLARRNHHIDLALAEMLATIDDAAWFERAWPGLTRKRPLAIAVTMAPALRRLRDHGDGAAAEQVRDRLVPVMRAGVAERGFDPVDVLDAWSAPGLPTCTPFGHELP
jgi:hypothetical protein